MEISSFRVEPADYSVDFDDLQFIRKEVFVVEQQIPQDIEFDQIDPTCYHFIARDNQHNPIGTGRLSPDQKIGRIAVLATWRNQGVGKAILLSLIDKARRLGWAEVTLNAQVESLSFYEKYGFIKDGTIFNEVNIPHQRMRLVLTPISKLIRSSPSPRATSTPAVELKGLAAIQPSIIELIAKAGRQLYIYTPDLEYDLYGSPEIIEALKQFAIRSRGGNVLVIVQDTLAARSFPHPLMELAQRLPSTFLFRTPVEKEDLQYSSAFLINDRDGYLFRLFNDRYQGNWSPNLPSRNRQLFEEFDPIWQRSRPCTEFRSLGL